MKAFETQEVSRRPVCQHHDGGRTVSRKKRERISCGAVKISDNCPGRNCVAPAASWDLPSAASPAGEPV